MQRIIYLLCISLFIVSCAEEKKIDGFVINGEIDSPRTNVLVKLIKSTNKTLVILDSTRIQGNTFELNGKVETPDMYYLTIDGVSGNIPLIVENETFNIKVHADSLMTSVVSGSKENDYFIDYQSFVKNLRTESEILNKQAQEAQKVNDTVSITKLRKSFETLMKRNEDHDLDFMKKNNNATLSTLILERALNSNKYELSQIKEIHNNFTDKVKNTSVGKNISAYIIANEKTAIGSIAPNFSAPNPEGKTITLNDIKGKVTIIDFWAAWCGPCRKENPNVVKVYEKYHAKGLEIIGISLDGTPKQKNAKQAWIDAIAKDNLTWHHVSNLKYFNDPIAKEFNINSIPATFIIDAEGKIVAKNLRGSALEKKIAELLN